MKALVILVVLLLAGYYLYEKYWDIPEAPVVQEAPVVISNRVQEAQVAITRHLRNGNWPDALMVWETSELPHA